MMYEAEEYVVPNCRAKLNFGKTFLQVATRVCQLAKPSCKLRQEFVSLQNLPASCGKSLSACKTFLQVAASICQLAKPSCKLRQVFVGLHSRPPNWRGSFFPS